jgi:hypothetical protein
MFDPFDSSEKVFFITFWRGKTIFPLFLGENIFISAGGWACC